MDNTEEFRLLSLCSGYGRIELGLGIVVPNLRTVAYVEIEAFAVANLVAKMEAGLLDVAPVWTDIADFDGQPFRGRIHIVTAGYPCQPFSLAARRFKKERDDRNLWPIIRNIISTVKPYCIFGENVAGHLSRGFDLVVYDLDAMGYRIEAGLFNAAECGAPHIRQRLFFLANSNSNLLSRLKMHIEGMEKRNKKTSIKSLLLPDWPPGPISQSLIPRATDGSPCQVDRLRLLGNGVVPQQAAKAFRYLMEKMLNTNDYSLTTIHE